MRLTALVLFGLSLATQAAASDMPGVYLDGVSFTGTGCSPDSTVINIAPDGGAFTVVFGDYTVAQGDPTRDVQDRRICNMDLSFHVPAGWTFALTSVDFRGYADLTYGANGQEMALLAYPPRTVFTRLATMSLSGPMDSDYLNHVVVPLRNRLYAPCAGETRHILLNTTIGVMTSYGSRALMTSDSIDGVMQHRYVLDWRQCR